MSLFGRKKEEAAPEPEVRTPPDDANWHVWDNAGRGMLGMGLVADAVFDYCQAVDRFDGSLRDLERFKSRIAEAAVALAWELAPSSKGVPAHIVADIDREVSLKHPDMDSDPSVTDLIAEGCDRLVPKCTTPGELYMLCNCSLYCTIGYLRYSFDPSEDIIRCARCEEMCTVCADVAEGMGSKRGQMTPKDVARYLRAYAEYCADLKVRLGGAVGGMTKDGMAAVVQANRSRMGDLVDPLIEALDGVHRSIRSVGPAKLKGTADWKDNQDRFAKSKTSPSDRSDRRVEGSGQEDRMRGGFHGHEPRRSGRVLYEPLNTHIGVYEQTRRRIMANRIRCPGDYVEMTCSERDSAVGAGMSKEDWIGIGAVALSCVAMDVGIYLGNRATAQTGVEKLVRQTKARIKSTPGVASDKRFTTGFALDNKI